MLDQIKAKLSALKEDGSISGLTMRQAHALYVNGQCQMLTCARDSFHIAIDDEFKDFDLQIDVAEEQIQTSCSCKSPQTICHHGLAGLLELSDYLQGDEVSAIDSGKTYTREGMIKRVMDERLEKAQKAEYQLEFADNLYGEHELVNERGLCYRLTFRDLEKEQGYCSCPDYRTNKLGTCKHLLYAFAQFRAERQSELPRQDYPFVDIYLDPFNNEQISWFYPQQLPADIELLFKEYFSPEQVLRPEKLHDFIRFSEALQKQKEILIRPEVLQQIEKFFEQQLLDQVQGQSKPDFSRIKAELFPYQKEGIEFATFRKGAILADEMGLGKTLQALGTAILKKAHFGFERTLVVCPASLKDQWKNEIERFSDETALVVQGSPSERAALYREADAYFLICNYEATWRDLDLLRDFAPDFIILDEAQRIKNYETRTAACIKQIPKKHGLVITGTPIENRLVDLYSIVDFLDPQMLSPLWEFSYQHCCFDTKQKNKIAGYYNLQGLKERLRPILLRREKIEVLKQLPQVTQLDIPIELHQRQVDFHASYASGVAKILRKKFMTPFDLRKLQLLLSKMRMVCDSTSLVDPEQQIHYSPKLDELRHILLDKLGIKNGRRKIVIFSEWVRMNHIIGRMLRENNIGFVELNGKVPVSKRAALIEEFEQNDCSHVFLSTEAGGAGLNLQVADTVINFELPWNPAKKNQRIGRIDRLGQKSTQLTVINLISKNSIESRIADGLLLKQNLFEGVLSPGSCLDSVDFSNRGRSQFLQQLDETIDQLSLPTAIETEEVMTKTPESETTDPLAEPLEAAPNAEGKMVSAATSTPVAAVLTAPAQPASAEQLTQVMNQGMAFLSGLMQMTTGQTLRGEDAGVEVNAETGEVVMKFKLPGMGAQ